MWHDILASIATNFVFTDQYTNLPWWWRMMSIEFAFFTSEKIVSLFKKNI